MQVRIKFSADVYIEGNSLKEIRDKFERMPLFSDEALKNRAEFNEYLLIEDANNYKDLWREYWENLLIEDTKKNLSCECRENVENMKDDDDVRCPYCGSDEPSFIDETNDYYCPNCHNSFNH